MRYYPEVREVVFRYFDGLGLLDLTLYHETPILVGERKIFIYESSDPSLKPWDQMTKQEMDGSQERHQEVEKFIGGIPIVNFDGMCVSPAPLNEDGRLAICALPSLTPDPGEPYFVEFMVYADPDNLTRVEDYVYPFSVTRMEDF